MSRFLDLFQNSQPSEEVFAPAPVSESVEVSAPELSAPEAFSEEKEVFTPNARGGYGDGLIQEASPYEKPGSQRKTRARKRK